MSGQPVTILLTGAAGQLGSAVRQELGRIHHLVARDHRELDLVDPRAVRAAVTGVRPQVIVNCVAYTDVDGAERQPLTALEVNAFAVRTLAGAARDAGAALIHFSTDFVFDGRASIPYTEEEPQNPRSTYAMSKLLGEWFARDAPRHYVLRVESLFGGPAVLSSARRSSLDRILEAIAEGREVKAFVDRTVSPSYVIDVARAVGEIIRRKPAPGVYHCVNSGSCTWHELAREVERLLDRQGTILGVSADSVKLLAERPKFAALSNAKLATAGIEMPTWQDALARHIRELASS